MHYVIKSCSFTYNIMLLSWADLMSVQPIFQMMWFGVLVCTLCTDVSSMMSPRTFRSPDILYSQPLPMTVADYKGHPL